MCISSQERERGQIKKESCKIHNQHVGSEKPVTIVDPEFLKDRTKDDDAVEAVEGRLEVGHDSKSIHTHPCSKLIEFHNCIS